VFERLGQERHTLAESGISDGALRFLRRRRHRHIARVDMKLGPLCARERPFVLMPFDEFLAGMAYLQLHLRLLGPARIITFEEASEEPLLQIEAVVRVEMRPMLDAVNLEPFLIGCGAHEAFEIAAWMQTLPTPIGGGQQGSLHLAPVGHARLPVLVGVELARDAVFVKIPPIMTKLLFR
jgi:hypothetical protein